MSFNYKNPISPITSLGVISVPRTEVYGTNFSVLSTGGFMEVYSLNDLYFTIPSGSTGLIEYTGNTIPIQFQKGTGSVFSPDVLTLNSDNISSGRRRLGMLVYVIEQDQIYQYQIPNFESLRTGATSATGPGGPTVVMSDFGTTIKTNSPEGISFVSAWTANTIEGISGETSSTAVWKKLVTGGSGTTASGEYLPLSGGTVTGDTIFTSGLTANTFSASTYLGLPIDIFVTGGTYSAGTATFTNNSGGTFDVTGFTDVFVTGATYDNANTFTFTNNTGGTYSVNINEVTGWTINGDLIVTGNTNIQSFSATTGYLNSSGSIIFQIDGIYGTLLNVSNGTTGLIYNINTPSGYPIFEVYDDSTILMGSYLSPSLNTTAKVSSSGTTSIYSIPISSYTGSFFDYIVTDGTNLRAGNVMSIWNGLTIKYTEITTNSIGDTSPITFSVVIIGTNAVFTITSTSGSWTIKTIVRAI